jgi:hypothetical protein
VPLCEHHRRIEADHREAAGDVEDRPDDLLADPRLQEVELRCVVPGEARAVIAVVDEPLLAGCPVEPLEHDGRVAVVPVVVLEDDTGRLVGRQVRARERVRRIGRLRQRQEPLGMVDDPPGIDAHMVGDHVAREPDAAGPRAVAQRGVRTFTAEVVGDPVFVE